MTTPAQRVASGARFLDKERPGWHKEIKLTKLTMQAGTHCIIGQLYGSFWTFCRCRGFALCTRYGFTAPASIRSCGAILNKFKELTSLWKVEIHKRRAA
jgi:hypothetical protein